MAMIRPGHRWPNGAKAAIALTLDNMGEAADITRGLWPENEPIGHHYSVRKVLPQMLSILEECDVRATYFIEAYNLQVYPQVILNDLADAGHEIAWHAWRHEAWSSLKKEEDERANFARSFGEEGMAGFRSRNGKNEAAVPPYAGFRPPGGVIHGERTLSMCKDFGLSYISPAGKQAAVVPLHGRDESMIVLPYRWSTVDAYYYMDSFAGLRKIKGELSEKPQTPDTLLQHFTAQVDEAITNGEYRSLLFHPFLTDRVERLEAMRALLQHLVKLRDDGQIWLARCCDIAKWIREHDGGFDIDPELDLTQWR